MAIIKNTVKNLFRSEFYRNILSLFSGIFVARLIPAAFAIIIARIYAPENFGIFVLYLTIASVLSIVATGRYESALILTESDEDKKHLFRIAQKINFSVNGIALGVIAIYVLISGVLSTVAILMLALIPVYSFFFGGVQILRNILISHKQFKKLSWLEVLRALAIGVLQCTFFVFPETGLFVGAVLAQVFTFIFYSIMLTETKHFRLKSFSIEEKALAKRYINFPKFSIASEVFNFISSQLPVFMIKPFFGSTMLGLYSFSHRYISVPVQLVSVSISNVYIQKAQSLLGKPNELKTLTFSLFKRQFLIGIIPFTVLALWGANIFSFLFGQEWEFSGYLAQLIAPWLFVVMISSPLSAILIVKEKQKLSMVYNISLLITRILALGYGGLILKNISYAIGLYSLTGFLFFCVLGIYSLKLAGVNLLKTTVFVAKALLIISLPLILIKLWMGLN